MNFHRVQDGNIAFNRINGNKYDLVFLPGLRSDMTGTKALHIEEYAKEHDLGNIRFDYFGHGKSDGEFINFGITDWLENCLTIIDDISLKPVILIGSSLGGWLALLTALKRPEKLKAVITLAAAPDFTEDLIWQDLSFDTQEFIRNGGIYNLPANECDGEYPISYKLIESGRENFLLKSNKPIPINIPTYCIHGQKDEDVPFEYSSKIFSKITSDKKKLILRSESDHRLSSEADLKVLTSILDLIISED